LNLTIDTFAWAEMIRGSELATTARAAMERAEICLTPSIVLAEVAALCLRDGFENRVVEEELEALREASVIVQVNERLAIDGARAAAELRSRARARGLPVPGLADGLILATARGSGSQLLSGDPHFQELPETVWLG